MNAQQQMEHILSSHDHDSLASLVLVVVLDTKESTYQKPGTMALVQRCGDSATVYGMISGGCLEGDLALHCQRTLAMSLPFFETLGTHSQGVWSFLRYDTRDEADDLLGTALGCRGCLDLGLVPLQGEGGQRLALALRSAWSARSELCLFAFVTEAQQLIFESRILIDQVQSPQHPLNHSSPTSLSLKGRVEHRLVFQRLGSFCGSSKGSSIADNDAAWISLQQVTEPILSSEIQIHIPKRDQVLICGAGPDALPLIRLCLELDREVCIADHRPEVLDRVGAAFATALEAPYPRLSLHPLHAIERLVSKATFHAVVVMTHNLNRDLQCLEALVRLNLQRTYLGLLGPKRRRDELFKMLDTKKQSETGCGGCHPLDTPLLHSPVGMDIGARGPAEIALAILADVLRFHHESQAKSSEVQVVRS